MNKTKLPKLFYLIITSYFVASYLTIISVFQIFDVDDVEAVLWISLGGCALFGIGLIKLILSNTRIFKIKVKELNLENTRKKPKAWHYAGLVFLEISFWVFVFYIIMNFILICVSFFESSFMAYLMEIPGTELTFNLIEVIIVVIACYCSCKISMDKSIYKKIYITREI